MIFNPNTFVFALEWMFCILSMFKRDTSQQLISRVLFYTWVIRIFWPLKYIKNKVTQFPLLMKNKYFIHKDFNKVGYCPNSLNNKNYRNAVDVETVLWFISRLDLITPINNKHGWGLCTKCGEDTIGSVKRAGFNSY